MEPIQIKNSSTERPIISESREPLVAMNEIENRMFIRSSYYEQQLPDSLQTIYLRRRAAEQLNKALSYLPEDYSFILYDGFRPLQVQSYLFEQVKKETTLLHPTWTMEQVLQRTLKYVAFPSIEEGYPAPHLTGGAIDLTLGDRKGNPLDLGTKFDETNPKSATAYFESNLQENPEALKNRRLLFNSMSQVGFQNYEEEWWHYDFGNITWARRCGEQQGHYGPILAAIENHKLKGYQFK